MITTAMFISALLSVLGPFLLSTLLERYFAPSHQQYLLMKCFSLLGLGMCLSALATLNFSLAFLVGLLTTPLTFIPQRPQSTAVALAVFLMLTLMSPFTVLIACTTLWGLPVKDVLLEAAFGWAIWGMRTQVVVWCVWWPAWVIGMVINASSMSGGIRP